MSKKVEVRGWSLVDHKGEAVSEGDVVVSFRGEHYFVAGGDPPRHSSSTGRVYVKRTLEGPTEEYFPSVVELHWEEGPEATFNSPVYRKMRVVKVRRK